MMCFRSARNRVKSSVRSLAYSLPFLSRIVSALHLRRVRVTPYVLPGSSRVLTIVWVLLPQRVCTLDIRFRRYERRGCGGNDLGLHSKYGRTKGQGNGVTGSREPHRPKLGSGAVGVRKPGKRPAGGTKKEEGAAIQVKSYAPWWRPKKFLRISSYGVLSSRADVATVLAAGEHALGLTL